MALVAERGLPVRGDLVMEGGRTVYVEYEDEPGFFHARLILMKGSAATMLRITEETCENPEAVFWILTPDGDIYPEQLSTPPLTGLVLCSDDGLIARGTMRPPGRRLRRAYGFGEGNGGVLTPLMVSRAIRAATAEEDAPRRRITRPPDGVSFGQGTLPAADGGLGWTCVGPPRSPSRGQLIETSEAPWVRLRDTLITAVHDAPVVCSPATAVGGERDAEGDRELDARVLSVHRAAGGERRRNFKDAVAELIQSDWEGWPVHGPRTFLWCCRFIVEFALHPLAHHTRFVQLAQLSPNDPGAHEHELAMPVMEYAICFDQLQGSGIAALEVVARRAQLIELRHRDKVIGNNLGVTVDDDAHIYLGTGRTRGLLMVAPALEEWVAKELSRETSAAKERRKLREERSGKPPSGKK